MSICFSSDFVIKLLIMLYILNNSLVYMKLMFSLGVNWVNHLFIFQSYLLASLQSGRRTYLVLNLWFVEIVFHEISPGERYCLIWIRIIKIWSGMNIAAGIYELLSDSATQVNVTDLPFLNICVLWRIPYIIYSKSLIQIWHRFNF